MEKKDIAVVIDGKKYEYRKSKHDNVTATCEECALLEMCNDYKDGILCDALGMGGDPTGNFQPTGGESLSEKEVYDYYQERSGTAGSRADQLAWMFVIMMAGGLVSGHAYQTFSVCAALSAAYMFFSIMQAVWQTFASWLFLRRVKRADVAPDDYPSWVGGGAWLFFWLKTAAISAAAFHFVHAIFS